MLGIAKGLEFGAVDMNDPKQISLIGHVWRWLVCVSAGIAVAVAVGALWDWYFGDSDGGGISHNAIIGLVANASVVYLVLVVSNKRRAL
jgi:hypothetical protein